MAHTKVTTQKGICIIAGRDMQSQYPLVKSVSSTEPQPYIMALLSADGVHTGGRTATQGVVDAFLRAAEEQGAQIERIEL